LKHFGDFLHRFFAPCHREKARLAFSRTCASHVPDYALRAKPTGVFVFDYFRKMGIKKHRLRDA